MVEYTECHMKAICFQLVLFFFFLGTLFTKDLYLKCNVLIIFLLFYRFMDVAPRVYNTRFD